MSVKFVRIRGRVVPIKDKEESGTKTYFKGVGLTLAGAGMGKILLENKSTEKVDIDVMKNKYKDLFKKAGNPDIVYAGAKGAFAYPNSSSKLNKLMSESLGVDIKRKSVILGTERGEAVLLHELGHLRASRVKGSMNYFNRKQNIGTEKILRTGNLKNIIFRSQKINAIKPITNLISEAEASIVASKHAFKYGGFKTGAKVSGRLSAFYSTYALVGAGTIMSSYGMYKGVRNTFFKKKGEK